MRSSRPHFDSFYEEDEKSMGYYADLDNGWGLRINIMPKIVSAAEQGDNQYIEAFCEYHKARGTLHNINAVDTMYNRTALFWAATNNHVAVVKTLLKYGANPNTEDYVTRSAPLNTAAEHGHLGAVDALVSDKRTDVNHLRSNHPKYSYRERMVASVLTPMRRGDVPQTDGISPLWIAAYHGQKEIVKRLLACDGINIDVQLLNQQTALDIALTRGHEAIAKLIIEARNDARWKNSDEYKEQQRKAQEEKERAQEEKERAEAEELLKRNEAYLITAKTFLDNFRKQNSGTLNLFHRPSAQSQQLTTDLQRLINDNSDTNTKADNVRTRLSTYHTDRKWKEVQKKSSRTIDLLKQSHLWPASDSITIKDRNSPPKLAG